MKITYKYLPNGITPMYDAGGFNKRTKKIKPFAEFSAVYEILDVMTAAAEAGVLDSESWVSQLFAGEDVFLHFLSELEVADDYMRIYDRWYQALLNITGNMNEEGFVTSAEIADELRMAAARTYQI